MNIIFGPHAEDKFCLFEERGLHFSKEQIIDCLQEPDTIEQGHNGRWVAQKSINEKHVLRVVFENQGEERRVITFYPGRKKQYENKI